MPPLGDEDVGRLDVTMDDTFCVGSIERICDLDTDIQKALQFHGVGQVLINTGVLTLSDLQALGWVAESLPTPVPHAVGLDWLRVFDLKLSWPVKITDKLRIEPSMGVYNLFNFANFDLPGNTQGGVLSGTASNGQEVIAPNVVGGTDYAHRTNRATIQSGTFALGAPRSFEWGLRLSF